MTNLDRPADDTQRSMPRAFWATVAHPVGTGFLLTIGGLIALLFGLAFSNLSTVFIYITFAMFAALGLDPIVRWFEARKIARPWAIVIVYVLFAILLLAVILLIVPTAVRQLEEFFADIPSMMSDFRQSDVFAWLQAHLGTQMSTLATDLQMFFGDPGNLAAIGGGVLQAGASIATGISGIIIVLVLSLYFLASLPVIKESFYRLAPARNRPSVTSLTEQITDSIGGYLTGMVILAFFNSMVAFFLYFFLGLPFPALMGVVAFSLTLIPLVGSVLFWIVGSMLALFANPVSALIFAAIYLIYMQLEAYILTPRVMSRAISVPGALVVIGALVGGTLLGLLGALVAIPVTASILLILKQVFIPRQDAKI